MMRSAFARLMPMCFVQHSSQLFAYPKYNFGSRVFFRHSASAAEHFPATRLNVWRRPNILPNSSASPLDFLDPDRKSTRLNSSHLGISYAVFCLKKKIE